MQTAEKKVNGVQGATAKNNNSTKTANRPNITGKETKNEPDEYQKPAESAETEAAKTPGAAAGGTVTVVDQSANAEPQTAAAEVKKEPTAEAQAVKEEAKPVLTLDAKLKAISDLNRKSIQRLALISRIKLLEDFEVKLMEENDELENNTYQGCKLIIEDDKRRQFVTNTPRLIQMVAQFIFDACNAKLDEIESTINFPQA